MLLMILKQFFDNTRKSILKLFWFPIYMEPQLFCNFSCFYRVATLQNIRLYQHWFFVTEGTWFFSVLQVWNPFFLCCNPENQIGCYPIFFSVANKPTSSKLNHWMEIKLVNNLTTSVIQKLFFTATVRPS